MGGEAVKGAGEAAVGGRQSAVGRGDVPAISAAAILDALIAVSDDAIWATELAFFNGMRRIDFFTIQPTASARFRTSAYEIKVSRADFRRDSEDKQQGALKWSDRFWYVTPPALVDRAELPRWAGLLEFDGSRMKVVRKAPPRDKAEPDWMFIVSMLRNSGDCRRDVGLMKTQINFLQLRLDMWQRQRVLRDRTNFERWLAKSRRGTVPAALDQPDDDRLPTADDRLPGAEGGAQ